MSYTGFAYELVRRAPTHLNCTAGITTARQSFCSGLFQELLMSTLFVASCLIVRRVVLRWYELAYTNMADANIPMSPLAGVPELQAMCVACPPHRLPTRADH